LGTICITFLVSALAIYFGFRSSVQRNADRELELRLAGIKAFLQQMAPLHSPESVSREFEQHAGVRLNGDPFQVIDASGQWVYRPQSMHLLDLGGTRPGRSGEKSFSTVERSGNRYRVLTATIAAGGDIYSVQLASNVTPIYSLLRRFLWIAIATIPIILLFAGVGGYWLSRRAMQPVYEITNAARRISERNLSDRLVVPEPRDELRQLSETLNDMLARLERAFNNITRFTADASHELRTPVAMIRTTAEHILQRERTVPEYQQLVGQILLESETTSDLIAKLLALARADERPWNSAREPIDLCKLVSELATSLQVIANQSDLQLNVCVADGPLIVQGDPNEVRNLVLIILDNAMKYTPAGGSVGMQVENAGKSVSLRIQDSGPGISEEDLPHIFERFYRADRARSRDTGGVGLGLSIAKSIAEAHGARIAVSSIAGNGSTFSVSFPSASAG
jgi:heavy metal sensor kinase